MAKVALKLKPLVHQILEDYTLPWHGTHGVGHWARVLENGLRLAKATGAAVEVVQLFAVFHDSRRVNYGQTEGDVTVQTCWDADRLDLGRVGMMPEPKRLCTAAAKAAEMLRWADGRATFEFCPDWVRTGWGIEL
jgi:uncharacterized protein